MKHAQSYQHFDKNQLWFGLSQILRTSLSPRIYAQTHLLLALTVS